MPPSICLSDLLAELIFLGNINVVEINAIQYPLIHDLPQYLLFHLR
jgi:hypothetical protein